MENIGCGVLASGVVTDASSELGGRKVAKIENAVDTDREVA